MLVRASRYGAVLALVVAFGAGATPASAGLAFSTFLGGSGYDDITAIAVDGAGNTYVAGNTLSSDFPTTPGSLQPDSNPDLQSQGFLTKFGPTGAIVYSTYLGFGYQTNVSGVAVDSAGRAYVVTATADPDYVSTLVVRVNAAGSDLDYAARIRGNETGGVFPSAIAVDGTGSASVTGYTGNTEFATTPGAFDESFSGEDGTYDAFVVGIAPDGAIAYSTLLGGEGDDFGGSIAVDGSGAAYVTGSTESTDFPSTPGTLGPAFDGTDTFLTKLDPTGASLGYSTSLGDLAVSDVAVDGQDSAYITGATTSPDFPATPGAADDTLSGPSDAFAAKLAPDAGAYAYATYLGGGDDDVAASIALGPGDQATVSGGTGSDDFPTTPGAFDTTFNGATDAFATVLDATGSAYLYSTFLGGAEDESFFFRVPMLAVDATGNPSLAGTTHSADFPNTTDAPNGDQFVTRLTLAAPAGGPCSQPGAIRGAGHIEGTPGDDVICGSAGHDDIDGRGGDDVILGNAGSDTIAGGAGADTVQGGRGADTVGGQAGADDLNGGRGRDTVRGAEGDDVVRGSDGNDTLTGGPGDDWLKGGAGFDTCNGGGHPTGDRRQECER